MTNKIDALSLRMQVAPYTDGKCHCPVIYTYEIFKPVPGFNNRYYISTLGRLFDIKQCAHCVPTISTYVRYTLRYGNNDFFQETAQRLMMMTFNPVDNMKNLYVVFLDHNPMNLLLSNMRWMNSKEKQQYMVDDGIGNVGANHSQTKYSEDKIRQICELLQQGKKPYEIQKIIPDLPEDKNFTKVCTRLKTGRGWKHIACEYNLEPTNKKFSDDFVHSVCNLLAQNKTNKEIAAILGVEMNMRLSSLCAHIRGHKESYRKFILQHPDIPYTPTETLDDIEYIAKMHKAGYNPYQISTYSNKKMFVSSINFILKKLSQAKKGDGIVYDIAKKYDLV